MSMGDKSNKAEGVNFVPSRANGSPHDAARKRIRESLSQFIGDSSVLDQAVDNVIQSLRGLLPKEKNLGATMMTEPASQRNPATNDYNKPPKSV